MDQATPEYPCAECEGAPERWLPVVGWEQNYQVSTHGNVWSAPRATTRGGILKQIPDRRGYQWVALTLNGIQTRRPVHQLVLEAFVGPRPPGEETRHLDGDPAHNHLSKIKWDTHEINMGDKRGHGTDHNVNKTHCPQGHEYTPDNTFVYEGRRFCRTCARVSGRVRSRNYAARKRAERGPLQKDCEFCGTSFTPKRKDARYCSRLCIKRAAAQRERREPEKVDCAYCGEPFMTTWPWQRYCSRRCSRRDNGY